MPKHLTNKYCTWDTAKLCSSSSFNSKLIKEWRYLESLRYEVESLRCARTSFEWTLHKASLAYSTLHRLQLLAPTADLNWSSSSSVFKNIFYTFFSSFHLLRKSGCCACLGNQNMEDAEDAIDDFAEIIENIGDKLEQGKCERILILI